MGKRLIVMVLASLFAMATNGLAAEETPQKPTSTTAKKTVKEPAASKEVAETSASKTPKKTKSSRKSASATKKSAARTKKSTTSTKKSAARTKASATNDRLPRYYGKLKLTDEQRSNVLAIQQDYQEQIQTLRAEIEKLESSRDAASLKVLSKSQRDLLADMTTRAVAKATAKKKK